MSNVEAIFQPKRLKEGRSFRGLTQLKLAEQIGITKQAISQFEKGTMVPNLDMTYQFVDILEFPINYFLNHIKRIYQHLFSLEKIKHLPRKLYFYLKHIYHG